MIVGTFGKAFGVNGGFVAASEPVAEAVRFQINAAHTPADIDQVLEILSAFQG